MRRNITAIGFLLSTVWLAACHGYVPSHTVSDAEPDYSVPAPFISVIPSETGSLSAYNPAMSGVLATSLSHVRPFRVPVLMYHYIRPIPDPKKDPLGVGLSVAPATFPHQLDILRQKKYHTISFAMLADSGAPLPKNPVILSFDDGYQDAYDQAFPILLSHHMTATFYIVSGFVGRPGYATWDELRRMSGSGMEIGAHTVDHFDLRHLSVAKQKYEIDQSIQTIDEELGLRVLAFAYPSGRYDSDTLKILKKSQILFAVTTNPGVATQRNFPILLPRVRISDKTDFKKLF